MRILARATAFVPAALMLIALPAIGDSAAQEATQVPVPDSVHCLRCSIRLSPVVTLGTRDGPGIIPGQVQRVKRDATGRYWIIGVAEPPLLFDSLGAFVRSAGRRGQGPGEFDLPWDVFPVPGDSVLVIDGGLRRATVFDSNLRPARTIAMPVPLSPAAIVRWPSEVWMNGSMLSPVAAGLPLHKVSLAGRDAAITASFGPDRSNTGPNAEPLGMQLPIVGVRGEIWSADRTAFRLTRWHHGGTPAMTFTRTPSWFAGTSRPWIGNPSTPPPPLTTAIHQDRDGLLWVFVQTASPQWRQAWAAAPRGARETRGIHVQQEKLFHTTIEVIDPQAQQVVARTTIPQWVVGVTHDRHVAVYEVGDDDIPRVRILSFQLERQAGRSAR